MLLAWISWDNVGGVTVSNVKTHDDGTDNGDVWEKVPGTTVVFAADQTCELWRCKQSAGTQVFNPDITVTFSATVRWRGIAFHGQRSAVAG